MDDQQQTPGMPPAPPVVEPPVVETPSEPSMPPPPPAEPIGGQVPSSEPQPDAGQGVQ